MNTSMIIITHDLGIVAEICDRVAIMYAGEIVESGTREHIFHRAAHPYTQGLFGCIPNMLDEECRLIPIQGMMPDPTDLPEGCRFRPRCPHACDRCAQGAPLIEIEPGHQVKCVLCEKEA